MRINEDYIEIDDFDKDDLITNDVEAEQEKHPDDYSFCIALDYCHITEDEKPLCRKKLANAFDTIPGILDYLLIYGSETDPMAGYSAVNIYIKNDFRKPSEVYKMMLALEKIFNPGFKNDMQFTFYRNGTGVRASTFISLLNEREKKRCVSDGYFYDFYNMC